MSGSSTASMQTVAGQISRVNTVTSLLKRFLSKDDSKNESRPPSGNYSGETGTRLGTSASSASIAGKFPANIGSMKITDQVIEEVDEQMTITSLRNKDDPRPTAQSLFQQSPSPSDPVDVPGRVPPYSRFHSAQVHGADENSALFPPGGIDDLLSSSAPAGKMPISSIYLPETMPDFDPKKFGSQESEKSGANAEELDSTEVPNADDFEKLRQEREAARVVRNMEKMAKSVATQQDFVNQIELQDLLTEALTKAPSGSGETTPTTEAK
jgi:bestrophin, other